MELCRYGPQDFDAYLAHEDKTVYSYWWGTYQVQGLTPKPLSLVTLSSGSGGDREEEEGVAGGEEVGNSGFWDRSLTLWFALKVKIAHIGSALVCLASFLLKGGREAYI